MGDAIQYTGQSMKGEVLQALGPFSSFISSIVEQALTPFKAEIAVLHKQVDSLSVRQNVQAAKVPHGCLSWEEAKTKRLLSIKQAAYLLGISEKSVRRQIDAGNIKASKALRHVRIPLDEIEAYQRRTV